MTVVRAAVLRSHDGPFAIEDLQLDEPRDDEVVVRMVAVGICHTDLLAALFAPPNTFPVQWRTAMRVPVLSSWLACASRLREAIMLSSASSAWGACKTCSSGHPGYCPAMRELNSFRGTARRHDPDSLTAWKRTSARTTSGSRRSPAGLTSPKHRRRRSSRLLIG